MRRKSILVILVLLVAVLFWVFRQGSSEESKLGGGIHGTLFAEAGPAKTRIALPGVEVRLEQDGQEAAKVATDLDGRFVFPRQKPGEYRVCWKLKGWVAGCAPEPFELGRDLVSAGFLQVRPEGGQATWGRVSLADGSVPGYSDPVFGVEDLPEVRVSGFEEPIAVNASGEFVVPRSLTDAGMSAKMGAETLAPLPMAAAAGGAPIEVRSPNHPPVVSSVVARRGDSPAATVEPGAILTVRADASDPDPEDRLRYRWAASSATAGVRQDGSSATWTVSRVPGIQTLYLLVDDGRGGFARGRVDVRVAIGGGADLTKAGAAAVGICNPVPPVPLCPGCPKWQNHPASRFLTRKGQGSEIGAQGYYGLVDPDGKRKTLGDWWAVNGFDTAGGGPTGADFVRASYLNNNDLGFGRDMSCIRKGNGDVACYVTNYGCPDQDPGNADLAAQADPANRLATVAMEYSVIEGQDPNHRVVKFFVYEGGTDASPRTGKADLDGYGAKFVPNLCNTCHGGDYTPSATPAPDSADMGSSFREFDLESFLYTQGRTHQQLTAQELADFRKLNLMAAATDPAPGIAEVIAGWYAAGGDTPDLTFAPAGWKSQPAQEELYLKVVAPSCRTCHVALRGSSLDWATYDRFEAERDLIQFRVCGANKIMPHAAITYNNFWLNHRPDVLKAFEKLPEWPAFGTCQ